MALTPSLVYSPHPFLAARDRRIHTEAIRPGESIGAFLSRLGVRFHQPVVLAVGDRVIPQAAWGKTVLAAGDLVTVRAVAEGDDSNKILRTVLTIAVISMAGPAAGAMLGTTSGFAFTATTALIQVGGMYLVNTLLPPPLPQIQDAQAESPTYSINGGQNRPRRYGPLPIVIGRHIVYPDLGAQPYTEFRGEDQYLMQVFNFGLSDITLSDLKIGQTPLEAFSGVETEVSDESGALDLFPTNVDTTEGGTFTEVGEWITRTTSLDTTAIGIDIVGFLFHVTDSVGLAGNTAVLQAEYRAVGEDDWIEFPGYQQLPTFPRGLVITTEGRTPIRYARKRTVSKGQYEVRVRVAHLNAQFELGQTTNDGATAEFSWAALRSYQPDTADYTGQKRLALEIQATAQLNGVLDALSAVAQAHCEAWDGSEWTRAATSNPAWWFRWLAKGKRDAAGRRLFGAGLADERIDEEGIKEWGAFCEEKGLTVNCVFDRPMNVDEMLTIIARCGRASPTWATGRLGVVWDAPEQPAVAVFGMGNIVRSSFEVAYATGKLADEIVANFVNPDLGWMPDVVRASVPGVSTPVNPVTVDLFGVTDPDQAGREALLLAAQQLYRRRRTMWTTDHEGLVPQRGDVVILSHDLTSWGYSGRLLDGTRGTSGRTLTLDRPVPFTADEDHYIGIRAPDGSYEVYDVDYQEGSHATIEIPEPLPADTDHPPQDYTWVFEPLATPGRRVKIVAVEPLAGGRFRFTAVDDNPAYYAAEENPYTYTEPGLVGERYPQILGIEVSDTLVRIGSGFGVRVSVTWDVAGEYGGAWARYRVAGAPWHMIGSTPARAIEFDVASLDGVELEVEVSAYNQRGRLGDNSTATATHTIVGKSAPPSDVSSFAGEATATGIRFTWQRVPDVDLSHYEIRQGASWDSAAFIAEVRGADYLYRFREAGEHAFLIKAFDTSGNESAEASSSTVTINAPSAPTVTVAFEGAIAAIRWTASAGHFPIVEYEVRYGATFGAATVVGRVTATSLKLRADWGGARRWWVVGIDAAGNFGTPGTAVETIEAPEMVSITHRVIDNFVYLYWAAEPGTLPIERYRVYRGETIEGAQLLGETGGTFQPHFESQSGEFTYWIQPVDTAGNAGDALARTAAVDQPPDYVLFDDLDSTFSGDLDNAHLESGAVLMPVNTQESFEDHFEDREWASPQDQIDAGYDRFIQPTPASGSYTEVIDYGAVLPGSRIKVTRTGAAIAGAPSVSVSISIRADEEDPWQDHPDTEEIFGIDFRYVKVVVTVTNSTDKDIYRLSGLNIRLDVKEETDVISVVADAGDAGGTEVLFNKEFIDVRSITAGMQGNTPGFVTWDFLDAPDPTGLLAMAWDAAGNRDTRTVTFTIRGVAR